MRTFILLVAIIIIFICMFSYTVNTYMMNDEQMYVSAGVLAQTDTIYKNFAYLQMPYLPMIYAGIYKITGTEYYLLYARIFSFLSMFASVIVIYLLGYLITKNFVLALMGVLLYSFNEITIHAMGFAWNAAPPVVFSLLAIYFFLRMNDRGEVKPVYVFIAGLCIAIAGGIKLYYLMMILPFIAASLLFPHTYSLKYKIRFSFVPLSVGFGAGLLPALYYFFNDPQVFLFNNLGFHALNYTWHLENEFLTVGSTTTILSKLRYLMQVLGWQTIMPFLFVVLTGIVLLVMHLRSIKTFFVYLISNKDLFVISTVIVVAVISALQPSSLWQHHLAYPFPFKVLFIFSLYKALSDHYKKIFLSIAAIAALLVTVYGFPVASMHVPHMGSIERWTPVRYHNESRYISNYLQDDAAVATIEPLRALEGGLSIYPEFSTGHFLFQVSDMLDTEERTRYRTTSVPSLPDWIREKEPPVVMIPAGHRFQEVFYKSIEHDRYLKIEEVSDSYVIYVRAKDDN